MASTTQIKTPMRVSEIVEAKQRGADIAFQIRFEILPVDFQHGRKPFQAYIFLAHYYGAIDHMPFDFRKCYARGCPHNLCTHVSQAVNIANRYLQRDYQMLRLAGIEVGQELFTLDAMIVKFERLKEAGRTSLTIPELVRLAQAGKKICAEIDLDYLPAVEHFAHYEKARTFLSGEINARADDETYHCHRCFACYATKNPEEEKSRAVKVANARLELMYGDFERVGIDHQKAFFND